MPNFTDQQPVLAFIMHPDRMKALRGLAQKYGLEVERTAEQLQMLAIAIVKGEASLEVMPGLLGESLDLDEEKAKKLASDLAGEYLLPLQLYIGDIKQKITQWGGDLSSYQPVIVEKQRIKPDDLIATLAKKIGLELPEPLLKRFIYLGRGYLTGERDREATMLLFKRPINIGGLELTDDQTLRCLEMLDAEKKNVEIVEMELGTETDISTPPVTTEAIAKPVVITPPVSVTPPAAIVTAASSVPPPSTVITQRNDVVAKSVTQALTKEVPTIAGELMAPHEKKEVEGLTKKMAQVGIAKPDKKASEAAVNQALEPVVEAFKAKRLSRQDFSDLAGAHVRGTRELHQTERLLLEKYKFSQAEADELLKSLELARKAAAGVTRPGGPPAVDDVREEKMGVPSLPAGRGCGRTPEAKVAGVPTEAEVMDLKHATLTGKLPTGSVEPILPTARVSAARSKEEELAGQAAKVDDVKIKEAVLASRPAKAQAKVSAPSTPPRSNVVPAMTDVKFAPHLTGPVEELGNMTPEQFRRLSSDPMEAIRKILDKLSLLQGLSYQDRVRGVEAWRSSPICTLYLGMASEGLRQGVSIAEISTRRRNGGEESLSPAEIKAIMELNHQIKF